MGSRVSARHKKARVGTAGVSDKDDSLTLLDLIRIEKNPRQRRKNPASANTEQEEQKENATAELSSSSDDDDIRNVYHHNKRKRKFVNLYDILKREPQVSCMTFSHQDNGSSKLTKSNKSIQSANEKGCHLAGGGRVKAAHESLPFVVRQSKDIHPNLEQISDSLAGQPDDMIETLETLISFSDSQDLSQPVPGSDDPALDCSYSQETGEGKQQKLRTAAALGRPRPPQWQAAGNGRSAQSRLWAKLYSRADLPVSGAGLHKCEDAKNCQNACVAKAVSPNLDHMSHEELIYWYEKVTRTKFRSRPGEKVRGRIRRVIRAEVKKASGLNGKSMASVLEASGRRESRSLETRSPVPAQLIIDLNSPDSQVCELSGPTRSKEDISCAFNSAASFEELVDVEIVKASINFSQTKSDTIPSKEFSTEEAGFCEKWEPLESTLSKDKPLSCESVEVQRSLTDVDLHTSHGSTTIETICGGAPFPSEKRTLAGEQCTDIVDGSQRESHEGQSLLPSAESSFSDTDSLGIVAYHSLEEMRVSQMDLLDGLLAQSDSEEFTKFNPDLSTTGESNPFTDVVACDASGKSAFPLEPRTPSPALEALEVSPEKKASFGESEAASPESGPEECPLEDNHIPIILSHAVIEAVEVPPEKKPSYGKGPETSTEILPPGSPREDDDVPTILSKAANEKNEEVDSSHSLAEQESPGHERNAKETLGTAVAVEGCLRDIMSLGGIDDAAPERVSEGGPMEDDHDLTALSTGVMGCSRASRAVGNLHHLAELHSPPVSPREYDDVPTTLSTSSIERNEKVDRSHSLADKDSPCNGQENFDMMVGVEGSPQDRVSFGGIVDNSPEKESEYSGMEDALSTVVIERTGRDGAVDDQHYLRDGESPFKEQERYAKEKLDGMLGGEGSPQEQAFLGRIDNDLTQNVSEDTGMEGDHGTALSKAVIARNGGRRGGVEGAHYSAAEEIESKEQERYSEEKLDRISGVEGSPQENASFGKINHDSPGKESESSGMEDGHVLAGLSIAVIERNGGRDGPADDPLCLGDVESQFKVQQRYATEGFRRRDRVLALEDSPQENASLGRIDYESPGKEPEYCGMEDDHVLAGLGKTVIERNGGRSGAVDVAHYLADEESELKEQELYSIEKLDRTSGVEGSPQQKASFGRIDYDSPGKESEYIGMEDDHILAGPSKAVIERSGGRDGAVEDTLYLGEERSQFKGQEWYVKEQLDGISGAEGSSQGKVSSGRIDYDFAGKDSEDSGIEGDHIQTALSKSVIERNVGRSGAVGGPLYSGDGESQLKVQEHDATEDFRRLDRIFGVEDSPQENASLGRIDYESPGKESEYCGMEDDHGLAGLSKAVIERNGGRDGAVHDPLYLGDEESQLEGQERYATERLDRISGVEGFSQEKASFGSIDYDSPEKDSEDIGMEDDHIRKALSNAVIERNGGRSGVIDSPRYLPDQESPLKGQELNWKETPDILSEGEELEALLEQSRESMSCDKFITSSRCLAQPVLHAQSAQPECLEPRHKSNCDLSTSGESSPSIDLWACEKLGEEGSSRDFDELLSSPQKKASVGLEGLEGSPMEDDYVPTALSKAVIERNGERRGAAGSSHSSADQEISLRGQEPNPEDKPGNLIGRVIGREKRKASGEQSRQSMNWYKVNASSGSLAQSLLDGRFAESDSPEPMLKSNCDLSKTGESNPLIDLLACEKLGEEGSLQDLEPPSKLPCRRQAISPVSQLELMRASSSNSPASNETSPPQKVPSFRLKLPGRLASQQGGSSLLDHEQVPGCSYLEPNTKTGRNEPSNGPSVSLDSSEDDTEDSCGRQEHGSRDVGTESVRKLSLALSPTSLGSKGAGRESVRRLSLVLSPTSPSPESARTDSSQNTSSQEPRDSQSISAPSSKGILKTGPQSCKGLCKCAACSTSRSKAGTASDFIASQMKTFQLIAGRLTKQMQGLRTLIEKSPEKTVEMEEALKKSRDVEEAADMNITALLRDCKRYCKLTAKKPVPMRKIVFADEAGQKLCHVKTFQSQSLPRSILDLL